MSVFTKLALVAVLPLLAHATTSPLLIHPGTDTTQCLGVASPANDAPTTIVSCAAPGGALVNWLLTAGDNVSVQLAGTNFCLDAGTGPHNNGPAKVYTCYPGTAQQHWYYTNDQHLAITGGTQCLDRTSGVGAPQTYQCTGGDANQVFSTSPGSAATPSTTPASTSTSTSKPSATPTCQFGTGAILYPAPGTNLTALYGGKGPDGGYAPVPFRFCTGQYYKTSSRNIQVVLTFGSPSGIVVAELTSTGSPDGGYAANLTIPLIDGDKPTFTSLLVLETYNDYYVPLGLDDYSIPIEF